MSASLASLAAVPVSRIPGLTGKRSVELAKAGITSAADLLFHVPRRYIDRSRTEGLEAAPLGEELTVVGEVKDLKVRRVRANLAIIEALVFDGSGYLVATWFNQLFRQRQLTPGTEVALSGKLERRKGRLQMTSPDADVLDRPTESLITGRIVPVHPVVGGVSAGVLRRAIHVTLNRSQPLLDPLPDELRVRLDLISREASMAGIHFPNELDQVEQCRRRLVFDELFRLELALALRKRHQLETSKGISHVATEGLVEEFLSALPFPLTGAQRRVIKEIRQDLLSPHPMHRLLQGEVGSGKTVVALSALLTAIQGGHQAALMAPTEVLAEQHFLGIAALLAGAGMQPSGQANLFAAGATSPHPIRLALLTASKAETNFEGSWGREALMEAIGKGGIDLVVGTHALIEEGVHFHSLGVAVVDEQHRFGVHQRVMLREKGRGSDPDLLIMTATPIPRTLAMTLYGDLDVSLLDEMPPGRSPTTTIALGTTPADASRWQDMVRAAVKVGGQVFVVCPLIEESGKIEASAATEEFERLQARFSDMRVGLIHGQLPSREKQAVMARLRAGELDILVATTVIEVGIDIPNATLMVIESANRFGLSQLHQLRGRVGRGGKPATCVLVGEPVTEEASARMAAMVATTDGFRLAEEDLRIRGQGSLFGARQAGIADLRIADLLRDIDLLVMARREAFSLVEKDPGLANYPDLAEEVRAMLGEEVEWLFIS